MNGEVNGNKRGATQDGGLWNDGNGYDMSEVVSL